ncbi:MAG: hypothetical protein KKD64_03385 [Alphaproteobacteria bacterium]|nr:hypothetical protein [Alphaproteobacteria bacterium]MBU0876158.1 hypothetical protein [Alphaproteobacteria bacterium]MBU1768679.1 hypothetical protein [Alphaproteobacteria bacterium]
MDSNRSYIRKLRLLEIDAKDQKQLLRAAAADEKEMHGGQIQTTLLRNAKEGVP